MRATWLALTGILVLTIVGVALLLSLVPGPRSAPAEDVPAAAQPRVPVFRLGVAPESDIFEQRRRYRALAAYMESRIGRAVELVSASTHGGSLDDLAEGRIDGAFLDPLTAAQAIRRHGARVLVKPELSEGHAACRAVIFVREDSPVMRMEDLADRSIALVRATAAGDLYPCSELEGRGLLAGAHAPLLRWMGTHDQVIRKVLDGEAAAGATKDHRLEAFETAHAVHFRRLATSDPLPTSALVVLPSAGRGGAHVAETLLAMAGDPEGRTVLVAFGITRFVPCGPEEFEAVDRMTAQLAAAAPRDEAAGGRIPR